MSIFQIVALVLLGALFAGNLAVVFRGQVSRRVGLPWSAVWLLAAVAILWPQTTTRLAHVLGIDRGADLVSYCFVLSCLVGFYMVYVRLRRLNADLTLLVRHLAIQNALPPAGGLPPQDTASASSTAEMTKADGKAGMEN